MREQGVSVMRMPHAAVIASGWAAPGDERATFPHLREGLWSYVLCEPLASCCPRLRRLM